MRAHLRMGCRQEYFEWRGKIRAHLRMGREDEGSFEDGLQTTIGVQHAGLLTEGANSDSRFIYKYKINKNNSELQFYMYRLCVESGVCVQHDGLSLCTVNRGV